MLPERSAVPVHLSGVEGLKSLPTGRSRRLPFEHICTLLRELIKHSPGDFGYQRSRWSTELLAIKNQRDNRMLFTYGNSPPLAAIGRDSMA
jgi:hypothetical protein